MNCRDTQGRLTAYLDGELDGDRGSVVRGHLRACATCRQVAGDEAALRDGLRALEQVDPPSSLWAGVHARLAAAEIADAALPAWRRATRRWAPAAPRFAAGGLVAVAAASVLWWRSQRLAPDGGSPAQPSPEAALVTPALRLEPVVPSPAQSTLAGGDVTSDLQVEASRTSSTYQQAADELTDLAGEARERWTEDRKASFDSAVALLRGRVDRAGEGKLRHRAWRELIRFLQGAVVRDDVALAGGAR